jgi:hypothetical protein
MHFFFAMLSAGTWIPAAPIHEFGHFLSISFEANLAYSVVIRLGNFTGSSIFAWTEREMLRVIPALSETPLFNERTFTRELEDVRKKFRGYIEILNTVCVGWAVLAALCDACMLATMPFHPATLVGQWDVIIAAALLLGAVPVGLLGVVFLNWRARVTMRDDSKAFDKMIELLEKAPAEKVERAHDALLKRLAEQRAAANVGR